MMTNKGGFVYIMASPNKTTLYTGVTSRLTQRVFEHRAKVYPESFSAKYNCVVLVYFCFFETIEAAIAEEKRIKGGSRRKKEELIDSMNRDWRDLWSEVEGW